MHLYVKDRPQKNGVKKITLLTIFLQPEFFTPLFFKKSGTRKSPYADEIFRNFGKSFGQ